MKRRFKIQDRFTNMKKADGTPMSRQQIHMLRKRARGLCWICSKPALEGGYFCLDHQIQARERMRKKLGCRRRNLGATSYKLKEEQDVSRSKREARRQSAQAKRASVKKGTKATKQVKAKAGTRNKNAKAKTTRVTVRTKAKTLPRTTRKMAARN
ncbi:MAG: hypothetical protein ACK4UN_10210 [Limisphaerales bacterium]